VKGQSGDFLFEAQKKAGALGGSGYVMGHRGGDRCGVDAEEPVLPWQSCFGVDSLGSSHLRPFHKTSNYCSPCDKDLYPLGKVYLTQKTVLGS